MRDRCLVLEDRMGAVELGGRLQVPSMQIGWHTLYRCPRPTFPGWQIFHIGFSNFSMKSNFNRYVPIQVYWWTVGFPEIHEENKPRDTTVLGSG
jgi:hypothetical protein